MNSILGGWGRIRLPKFEQVSLNIILNLARPHKMLSRACPGELTGVEYYII
jgi:hypothetical protein